MDDGRNMIISEVENISTEVKQNIEYLGTTAVQHFSNADKDS